MSGHRLKQIVFFLVVASMSFVALVACTEEKGGGHLTLENDAVRVTLSEVDGRILELFDKQRDRAYVKDDKSTPAFLVSAATEMQETEAVFSVVSMAAEGCTLHWDMPDATLTANIALLEDGVSFQASLVNREKSHIRAFEYPIVGSLADYGKRGYLAHPYATGVLFQDPQSCLPATGGLRYAPYPESFSGASMQFCAYYEENAGGLYFAALDGDAHQKWFNAYTQNGALVISHMTGYEEIGSEVTIEMPYEFHIRFMGPGGWREAAELYKPWALSQKWCRRGLAIERAEDQKADWLLEDVGYATFGINAGADRTQWLDQYRLDIGTKGFHILGPDWANTQQNFYNSVPGGLQDWLPTKFNQNNLENIRKGGDYYAPFEFDFLVGLDKSDAKKLMSHLQKFPSPTFSHDAYTFNMLCPADPFTVAFHRDKNVQMMKEAQMDAMYYDISANNLIKICLSDKHGHTPGGGHEITEGYQTVYQETQQALCAEAKKYVPLGTEMMNETLLGELDYYQARAWAQPSSTLETWPFRQQMRKGTAQMIPLFDYVYHEMGTVRLDGWGKLVAETGDYFYSIVSRVYLWGGLYEINHEYSPMEELNGQENSPEEHYFRFDPQHNAYSADRALYVKSFAGARTGPANPYWAYGTMTVEPAIEIPKVFFHWYHYNHGQGDSSYKASGDIKQPAVLTSAYVSPEGSYALFLSNAHDKAHTLTFDLSHQVLRLSEGEKKVSMLSGFDQELPQIADLGVLQPGKVRAITLELAPYTLYMLEIK